VCRCRSRRRKARGNATERYKERGRIGAIAALSLVACALIAVSLTGTPRAQLAASPWPVFRHDSQHTGQSQSDTSTNNGVQKWVFAYPDSGEDYDPLASPTLGADGTIYSTPGDNNLYAFNPDGTLKWTYAAAWPLGASPAIGADGTIYASSVGVLAGDDSYGYLYAVNPDGTLKWTFQTGSEVESSPAIAADGTIYVYCDDGKLYAINPDGTPKWALAEGLAFTNERSSPAIGGDGTIYFESADGNTYAVNPDGSLKWSFPASDGESSPAVGADGTIYVGSLFFTVCLYCHDVAALFAINPDGSLKWFYLNPNYSVLSSPAIGVDGSIYFGDGLSLNALTPDGTLKWEVFTDKDQGFGGAVISSPAIGADGAVYVGANDNTIYAVNPDGSIKWKFAVAAYIESSPTIGADGTIYMNVDESNRLFAIGQGVAPSPTPTATPVPIKLKISPSSLNFGTVEVGKQKGPKHIIVRNPKGGKKTPGIAVTILGVSGGGSPFSVEDGCSVSDLSPGDACSFDVTFAPTAAVSSTATLMIIDNAEQQSVDLSGKGVLSSSVRSLTLPFTVTAGEAE
jgi:outer membrane protein assembly factor BamB